MYKDSLLLQRKYADMLSPYLERFKVIRSVPFSANFRCDICGDSKKSKTKARGHITEREDRLTFKCFNCGESYPFPVYLKVQHPAVYQQYMFDLMNMTGVADIIPPKATGSFKDQVDSNGDFKSQIESTPIKRFQKFEPLKALSTISQLPDTNPGRQYVIERKIPTKYHYKLYYAPKFFEWINKAKPGAFSAEAAKYDSGRLIIPFLDKKGYCFGITARSLDPNPEFARYLTILFDETKPKIFGLDTVDMSKKVYILEGAIDSMFVENSLAFNGIEGDLSAIHDKVLVLDNEPRNKEVLDKYAAYIAQGYPICIWPSTIVHKDVNQMILSGYTPNEIQSIIDENTREGMLAQLAFNNWRRM